MILARNLPAHTDDLNNGVTLESVGVERLAKLCLFGCKRGDDLAHIHRRGLSRGSVHSLRESAVCRSEGGEENERKKREGVNKRTFHKVCFHLEELPLFEGLKPTT